MKITRLKETPVTYMYVYYIFTDIYYICTYIEITRSAKATVVQNKCAIPIETVRFSRGFLADHLNANMEKGGTPFRFINQNCTISNCKRTIESEKMFQRK